MQSRTLSVGKKTIFWVLGSVLTLGVLVAAVLGYFLARTFQSPFPRTDLRVEGDWLIEADPTLGYVTKKNATTRLQHLESGLSYVVYTDHLGARVNSPSDRTPEAVDIVVVGDSFAWGHGVRNEDTFAQRLVEQLNVRVANFGMAGYSTVQSMLMQRRQAHLKPHVVIYSFIADHLRRNLASCAPNHSPTCLAVPYIYFDQGGVPTLSPPHMEYVDLEAERRFYNEVLMTDRWGVKDVIWRMRVDLDRLHFASDFTYVFNEDTRRASIGFLMSAIDAMASHLNTRVILLYFPYLRGNTQPPPTELTEALKGTRLGLLDLSGPVAAHYRLHPEESLVLPDDFHPNPRAHRLVADALMAYIRQEGLLPASRWPR